MSGTAHHWRLTRARLAPPNSKRSRFSPARPGMPVWREKLFAQMHHNASGAADFLNLPNNSVVELGSKIEI